MSQPDKPETTDEKWPPLITPKPDLAQQGPDQTLGERAFAGALPYNGKHEQPGNMGPLVAEMNGPWDDQPEGKAWCAGFACTMYLNAGSEWMKDHGSLSTGTLLRRILAEGTKPEPAARAIEIGEARKGDLIFSCEVQGKPHHIGLFSAVSFTHLTTLGGNAPDQVRFQHYGRNSDGTFTNAKGDKRYLLAARIER